MPLQLIEECGGKILTVHVSGRVTKADFESFCPRFTRLMRHHGTQHVLFDMTDFRGWDAAALWEDIKFDLKHFADIERLAMVGDKTWQRSLAMLYKRFTRATIRYFDHTDVAEARKWLGDNTATLVAT